jgi:Polysaccharide biosynthesis protein
MTKKVGSTSKTVAADLEERHVASAFALNLATGGAVAVVFVALARRIAAIYGELRLTALPAVSAVGLVVASTTVVPLALLRRRLEFRRLAFASTSAAAAVGGSAGFDVRHHQIVGGSSAEAWDSVPITVKSFGRERGT